MPRRSRSRSTRGTRHGGVGGRRSHRRRLDKPIADLDMLLAEQAEISAETGPRPRNTTTRVVEETSAGGLVVQGNAGRVEVAVIARINRAGRLEWCLPKGHLEGRETPAQAAVREIAEETGILGEVVAKIGTIDYWFTVEGRRIHKTVHHYLLDSVGGHLTIENDPDAEAVDVAWVPMDELGGRLAFVNERRIARATAAFFADTA